MATISGINPTSGTPSGGTSVTVTGTGFKGGGASSIVSDVLFGTVAGTSVSVTSDTSLTVTSPAGTGTVDIIVKVESPVVGADSYTYGSVSPFVQKADSGAPTGNNTTKSTGSITQAGGNSNIVLVVFGSSSATSFTPPTVTLSDTLKNNYTLVAPFTQTLVNATESLGSMVFYCPSILVGSNAVTVTLGSSMAFLTVTVLEYAHAAAGIDAVVSATSQSGSTAMNAGLTTLTANSLVLGLFAAFDGSATAGTGFTSRDAYDKVLVEEINTLPATPGAVSVPGTSGNTNGWVGHGLALKRN